MGGEAGTSRTASSFAIGVQPYAMLSPLCWDGAGADSLLYPSPA